MAQLRSRLLLSAFVLAAAACEGSGGLAVQQDAQAPAVEASVGDAEKVSNEDIEVARKLTGRWTSSDGFEDPFEAEIVVSGGVITGRVCGTSASATPGSLLGGGNCGPIQSGWIKDHTVHFDFALPYKDLDGPVRSFQLVGAANEQLDHISGVLWLGGQSISRVSHWLRCPDPSRWCIVTEL